MALRFEWDRTKAASNARKHGVRFEEALTVFGDPLSVTVADLDERVAEHRFAIVSLSVRRRLVVAFHVEREETIRIISARLATRREKRAYEQGETEVREPEMRAEYDFRGGIRGKYADRFARGAVAVLLEPDVAERFPDSTAVNDALRALAALADRRVRPKHRRTTRPRTRRTNSRA